MHYGLAEEDYNSIISIRNGKYKLKRFDNKMIGLTVEAVIDYLNKRTRSL